MAISSYATLKTAISTYLHRSDLSASSIDDEAIDAFEAKISRRLKVRGLETSTTGTMSDGTATISLPTGFTEMRSFTYVPSTGSVRRLEFITPELGDALEYGSEGAPQWYSFVGGAISLYPTPDSNYAYTLKYYRTITPLDGTNTTNFLLASHPDVYLYGSLVEACLYVGDDPRLAAWKQALEEGIQEVIRADRRERFVSPVVLFDADLRAQPMTRNIYSDGE